jgi:MoxR-like ATPase
MENDVRQNIARLEENIASVVLGKNDVIRLCLVALLSGEHILLEDVPGVGKTLLGKALAKSVDAEFSRVQFTPDLLPGDILGTTVYDKNENQFRFMQGPIFSNIVLADEINRATPRTQSALLEAMSDRQVTADGNTYMLPNPFMVIATQNPFEFEGTYALPESQLDRFIMRISVGYPDRQAELNVLSSHRNGEPVESLKPVLDHEQVLTLIQMVREVVVDASIQEYLMDIVESTRRSDALVTGASTRGAISLYRASQALALIENRDFVVTDDIKRLAVPVFAHRLIPKGYAHSGQRDAVETLVERLIDLVPTPK